MNKATRSYSVPRRRQRKSTTLLSRKKPGRAEDPEDVWYQIKDIVDEKYDKGRLLYKIDWADNPTTGESYEQSWIPAEDANEDAVEDWLREKRQRAHTEPPSQGSNFDTPFSKEERAIRTNQKRQLSVSSDSKARRKQKRLRTVVESDRSSSPYESEDPQPWNFAQTRSREPAESSRLVVELKPRPDFDPAEYTAISSSQLSHESSSQVYNNLERTSRNRPATDISQRTIPDSQGVSASLFSCDSANSQASTGHRLPPQDSSAEQLSANAAQLRDFNPSGSTSTDIPSRQPDSLAVPINSQPDSHGIDKSTRSVDQSSSEGVVEGLPRSPSISSQQKQSEQTSDHVAGFLTQPDFILNNPLLNSSIASGPTTSFVKSESQTSPHSIQDRAGNIRSTASENFQQYAQIVPGSKFAVEAQTQDSWSAARNSEELQVVPETTRRRTHQSWSPRRLTSLNYYEPEHIVQSIEQGDIDEDHSRPSTPESVISARNPLARRDNIQRTSGRESTEMEGSNTVGTPTSIVERLRQIQAEAMGRGTVEDDEQNSHKSAQAETGAIDQAMTSPSAILPSVEPEHTPIEPQHQSLESEADGWHPTDSLPINGPADSSAQVDISSSVNTALPPLPTDDFQTGLGLNMDFPGPDLGLIDQTIDQDAVPATIAPSVLSTNAEADLFSTSSLPIVSNSIIPTDTIEDAVAGILPLVHSPKSSPDSQQIPVFSEQILRETDISGRNEQIVTLPLPANLRHVYLGILTENEPVMEEFTQVFSEDVYRVPDDSLVLKVDEMLRRLYDLCDLPASHEDIPLSTAEDMTKYARDTNSKFLFIYELLDGLRDVGHQVLILARPGRVMEFLEALLSARQFNYRRLDKLEIHQPNPDEPLRVILAPTNSPASELPAGVGLVLAFDHTSRSSGLLAAYETANDSEELGPMILSLVVTHSVEHIDLRISSSMDPLERKNALVVSVVQARDLIAEPERGYPEPHAAADVFASMIKDPTAEVFFEQQIIPDEVFEVYMSSQAQARATQRSSVPPDVESDRSVSRKRQLDDVGSGSGTPKRVRMAESLRQSIEPKSQISDVLRDLLGNHVILNGGAAEVPIERLEFLAAKITDLEYRLKQKISVEETIREELKSLSTQLHGYQRTIKKVQPKYMEALRDRGIFEAQRDTAVDNANHMKTQVENSRATVTKLKEEKKELEAKLAEATAALASSSVPEIARLARAESELGAEQKKVQSLEKKLANAQKDADYVRNVYQEASNKGADLSNENTQLSARVKELEQLASDSLVKIHQINAQVESSGFRQLWEDEQAVRRHREAELERIREELRVLRNGRRETRQASVPRSPRLGMMSPRNGRGAGPGSRGTSPAPAGNFEAAGPMPGMTYFNQTTGNVRFSHLRE